MGMPTIQHEPITGADILALNANALAETQTDESNQLSPQQIYAVLFTLTALNIGNNTTAE